MIVEGGLPVRERPRGAQPLSRRDAVAIERLSQYEYRVLPVIRPGRER